MWTDAFTPGLAPDWIRDFEQDSRPSLDALLTNAYYRGQDNLLDPSEALFEWSLSLAEHPDFLETLDAELSTWLNEAPRADLVASRRGWETACQVVASVPGLTLAAEVIRKRFRSPHALLSDFGIDAADDLYDATIAALVESQHDRALEPLWWTLVRLRGDASVDRGLRGILGLDAMPPADDDEPGGLRNELVDAMLAFGMALGERIEDRRLSEKRAAEAMTECVALLRPKYPFPKRWIQALTARKLDARTARWLRATGLDWPKGSAPVNAPRWGEIEELGYTLRIEAMNALRSGNFSVALERSEAALQWDPFSPYSWTYRMSVIAKVEGPTEALNLAWIARERFPEDAACWHQLGTYLEDLQRLRLAEEVRWESVERFPDHEHSVNSLGKLLALQGALDRATQVLEPYVARHTGSIQPVVTLGDVYRLSGRIPEAEAIFRPLVDQGSTNSYVWSGLLRVLRDSGRQTEAEQLRALARKRFPKVHYFQGNPAADPPTPTDADMTPQRKLSGTELATLRRRSARLDSEGNDASAERDWLGERVDASDLPPIVKDIERSLLLLDDGRADSAVTRLTATRVKFGDTVSLLYALARASREQAVAESARFSSTKFREAMEPVAALRTRTTAARPLAALSAVRLAYAMNDGQPLQERREHSVAQLRNELEAREDGGSKFDSWWSDLVRNRVLSRDDEVGVHLSGSARVLNELEEDAVTRINFEVAAW